MGLADHTGPDRQLANAYPRMLKDDDGACRDRVFDGCHVRQQQGELFRWFSIRTSPEDDQRGHRLVCEREQRAEIGVGRHDDTVFDRGMLENDLVVGTLKPVFTHMDGVVTAAAQPRRNRGREGVVDEEPHKLVSGSVRSRTASAAKRNAS